MIYWCSLGFESNGLAHQIRHREPKSNSRMPFLWWCRLVMETGNQNGKPEPRNGLNAYHLLLNGTYLKFPKPEKWHSVNWLTNSITSWCWLFPKHVWHSSIGVQLNLSKALLRDAAACYLAMMPLLLHQLAWFIYQLVNYGIIYLSWCIDLNYFFKLMELIWILGNFFLSETMTFESKAWKKAVKIDMAFSSLS